MSGVFISYRRADSAAFVGRLFDRLRNHFGRDRVFRDMASIPAGSQFEEVIADRISTYEVCLVVIGSKWLDMADEEGRKRLELPNDMVAAEITAALAQNKTIIPVLVEDQPMVSADSLPNNLRGLAAINAISVSDSRFDHDTDRLIGEIEKRVPSLMDIVRRRFIFALFALLSIMSAGMIAWYLLKEQPTIPLIDMDMSRTVSGGSQVYLYRGDGLEMSEPNRFEKRPVSDLAVLEDGVVLCPWTNSNSEVQDKGSGHFNHWICEPVKDKDNPSYPGCPEPDEYLIFSSSDNTDPRNNGRHYSLTLRSRLGKPFCGSFREVVVLPRQIVEDTENSQHGRHAYVYKWLHPTIANALNPDRRDPDFELLEDGNPLRWTPNIADIAKKGEGRYNHAFDLAMRKWYIIFSSSDNSDPRTNGRVYTVHAIGSD